MQYLKFKSSDAILSGEMEMLEGEKLKKKLFIQFEKRKHLTGAIIFKLLSFFVTDAAEN
jgi:hypothetical protein